MESKYSDLLSKTLAKTEKEQKQQLKIFSEAREKLQSAKSTRSKRSATTASPYLSQDQRSSIGKMYTLNSNLKEASKELALEFRSIVPTEIDLPVALAQAEGVSPSTIAQLLSRIRWEHSSIRTQKTSGSTNFYRKDSWGAWDENPFKTFYNNNERAFHSDIEKLQLNAREVNKQRQTLDRIGAQFVSQYEGTKKGNHFKQKLWDRKKEVALMNASKDSHIVERVANYLLKAMGQT